MKSNNGTSVDDLLSFLDWAADKRLIKLSTASSLKAASNKVLGILDNDENDDLSKIDVDKTFDRFKNRLGHELNPDSLKTYRSRTKKAIEEFLLYRKDPENWKPSFSSRSTTFKAANANKKSKANEGQTNDLISNSAKQFKHGAEDLSLTHQYPLRSDATVRIVGLPRDLKSAEAKRLSAFLLTLCEDYQPEV